MATKEEIIQNLKSYTYIEKRYETSIDDFIKKNHPLIDHIVSQKSYMNLLNAWLKKLDDIPNIAHLIKKSKNPLDFW